MTIGPDIVYACSGCGNPLAVASMDSGNNFDAIYYCDGSVYGPGMMEICEIGKCPRCHQIVWYEKLEQIGKIRRVPPWERKYRKVDFEFEGEVERIKAGFSRMITTVDDFIETVTRGIFETDSEERYLRTGILWMTNENERNGLPLFNVAETETVLHENNRRLSALLEVTPPPAPAYFSIRDQTGIHRYQLQQMIIGNTCMIEPLISAHLLRRNGQFQACTDLIGHPACTIPVPVQETLRRLCRQEDRIQFCWDDEYRFYRAGKPR
ncbi:MAG: hypothetical protein HUU10_12950 [Bacteroidetes bacterium]|nr:hypothetical protein [Bacteroidota bacterium]